LRYVSLPEISEMGSGGTPSRKKQEYYKGGTIPWLKSGELNNGIVTKAEEYITEKALNESSAKIAPKDSLLVAMYGATAGKVGLLQFESTMNQAVCYITPDRDKADVKYLYYYLMSKNQELLDRREGGGQPNISQTILKSLKIPLPTLSEQKAIVAKLDRAQRLIDIDREMLSKYDELIQSVFLEMFGDPVRNEKGFEKGTIRDIVSETKYGTNKKAHETDGEYPVIRMGNLLYNGEWDFSDMKYCDLKENELPKYLVHKGDVLFNRTNSKELVGKTGVYREEEPIAYAGYLIRVRPNEKATSEYISGYLNCPHGKLVLEHMCKNIVGMANINAQELQDIEILIPPIKLQKEYEQKVKEIRSQKSTIKTETTKSEELFSSLVQGVFG
jgi:type I restriction enzyme, S subunit